MSSNRFYGFIFLGASIGACGGAGPGVPTRVDPLAGLRAEAAASPGDVALQFRLAQAELFTEDGDEASVQTPLARIRAVEPDNIRALFMSGFEQDIHGNPEAALIDYARVLQLAHTSTDPWAPFLAEVAVSESLGVADFTERFDDRIAPELVALAASPGRAGAGTQYIAANSLRDWLQKKGRAADARAAMTTGTLRCADSIDVLGPIGPRDLLNFDADHSRFIGEAAFPAELDLGPGRGVSPKRTVHPAGCEAFLGRGPIQEGGVFIARSTVTPATPGNYWLRLDSPNTLKIYLGSQLVHARDLRREMDPGVAFVPVQLDGPTTVTVVLASRHSNPVLSVAFLARSEEGLEAPEATTPLERFVKVALGFPRGRTVLAGEDLRLLPAAEKNSAVASILRGYVSLADPFKSDDKRRDGARLAFRTAAQRDPAAYEPQLRLASLEVDEGRNRDAIELLRGIWADFPHALGVGFALIESLRAEGWHSEAGDVVEDLHARAPFSCGVRYRYLGDAKATRQVGEIEARARDIVACDARSIALQGFLVSAARWPEALAESRRIAEYEDPDSMGALIREQQIAEGQRDLASIDRIAAVLAARNPRSSGSLLDRVDVALARGQATTARTLLDQAFDSSPGDHMGLAFTRAALGGRDDLAPYRLDGDQVLAAFKSSGRTYDQPAILVLDYTVTRVYPDGSGLELTHNVWKLQSDEAVNAHGEFELAEGAKLFKLRTIKADGRSMEPADIAGKSTLSFPQLSPGDFIEYEFIRPLGRSAAFPTGYVGDRFFFRGFETPYDRSEVTVILPNSLGEPQIDARGEGVTFTKTAGADNTTVYKWGVRESRPLVAEPGSVPAREYLPSVNLSARAAWPARIEFYRDILIDKEVRDPEIVRLVEEIAPERNADGSLAAQEARARKLFAWTTANIEESGDFFGSAPTMTHARSGSRVRVLRYLLGLAGIAGDFALTRGRSADQSESVIPEEDIFRYPVLAVTLQGASQPVWLTTSHRYSPFGYVGPELCGQKAYMISVSGEQVTLPACTAGSQLHRIEAVLHLRAGGQVQVDVTEFSNGERGLEFKEQLEKIPAEDLNRQFEQGYAARVLAGARLESLTVAGSPENGEPLVMRYVLSADSLGRQAGTVRYLPQLFASGFGGAYAPTTSRTTMAMFADPLEAEIVLQVIAEDGEVRPPTAVSLDGFGASHYSSRVTNVAPHTLTIERKMTVPAMRVATTDYADFATFIRAADQAEDRELAVTAH